MDIYVIEASKYHKYQDKTDIIISTNTFINKLNKGYMIVASNRIIPGSVLFFSGVNSEWTIKSHLRLGDHKEVILKQLEQKFPEIFL